MPFNGERPGTDDLAGVGTHVPSRGEAAVVDVFFQDVLGVNGGAHRAQKRREGYGQGEPYSVVVDLGDFDLSALPFLRGLVEMTDGQARPRRSGDVVVVDDALEGEKDVVGREGRAVGPLDALAQMKRPHQAVVGGFPALGQVALHPGSQPGGIGHALEYILENFGRRCFGRDCQVEGLRSADRGLGQRAAGLTDLVAELGGVLIQPCKHRVAAPESLIFRNPNARRDEHVEHQHCHNRRERLPAHDHVSSPFSHSVEHVRTALFLGISASPLGSPSQKPDGRIPPYFQTNTTGTPGNSLAGNRLFPLGSLCPALHSLDCSADR